MRENQRPLAERGPGPFRGRGLAHPPTLLVVADFYPIFILRFEIKVSGVSVQDMLLHQSYLTPET